MTRRVLHWTVLTALASGACAQTAGPYLAQGELVGEVTPTGAIVRTRLTLRPQPNPGRAAPKWTKDAPAVWTADLPEGVPGAPGRVRIHYAAGQDTGAALATQSADPPDALPGAKTTEWQTVDEKTDYSAQFRLAGLRPGTRHHYRAECAPLAGGRARLGPVGSFQTAPAPEARAAVTFCVITGQAMRSRDLEAPGRPGGFQSYVSMAKLRPHFLVCTGDSVYYDNDGIWALDEAVARHHWNRLYALPTVRGLFRVASGYWEKDDHDYRWDDCWPSQRVPGKLGSRITDEMGRRLFRQAVPMGELTYRTFAWGKGLQIWLVEGRDYRSSNRLRDRLVDGKVVKTIWGPPQKAWLKKTLAASTCRYKVLISPTPLIGPDRAAKADNHANKRGFHLEGREFLAWAAENVPQGLYIICGDRHWQYHSVDPQTKVQEFSCGPISDRHAGGSPGMDPAIQKYHRVTGGFLSVAVEPAGSDWKITFRHHRPDGSAAREIRNP